MEFDKHDKARSLYTEVIARFVREEANTNPLITITDVRVAPNYQHITVLFTTIPDNGQEGALIFLKRKGGDLRAYLKKHARLKHIPHIDFEIDYGERHRQHIDEIARDIESHKK
ncbi:MAG TPA: ribosome-binding factor A [Candidatus Paceibacterota bacterium]|nr:ribosome-binding factor A [Candidatus Paceibacterota bacterium]